MGLKRRGWPEGAVEDEWPQDLVEHPWEERGGHFEDHKAQHSLRSCNLEAESVVSGEDDSEDFLFSPFLWLSAP